MKKKILYTVLPIIPMILWGSLFPFVKIGYSAFNIDSKNIGDIIMFAAFRFSICGIIVCVIAALSKAKIEKPIRKSVLNLFLMGIFSVILHYAFVYIGLANTNGSKAAILKQLGPLLYACFAFLFIKTEKFNVYKIIGATVGFCGIIAINIGKNIGGISFGDILILLASLCTVISLVISDICVHGTSAFWVTGISQLFGGAVMFVSALVMKGNIPEFNMYSTLVFLYICFASVTAYTLFFYIQKTVPLSKLFIIKFAEPLFACIFSAILLGEDIFKIQYSLAFILIMTGIILAHKDNLSDNGALLKRSNNK